MKDWWESLQPKERNMVTIGAVAVAIAFLYLVIWTPVSASRNNKEMRVENKRETVIWMAQKKREVEHLKRINPNLFNQATDSRSLLAIVDNGAKQMGTRSSITRIDPDGENKVSIWVEEISFDHLIVLLGELERRNYIQIADASLNKSDQVGKVSGKITLSR